MKQIMLHIPIVIDAAAGTIRVGACSWDLRVNGEPRGPLAAELEAAAAAVFTTGSQADLPGSGQDAPPDPGPHGTGKLCGKSPGGDCPQGLLSGGRALGLEYDEIRDAVTRLGADVVRAKITWANQRIARGGVSSSAALLRTVLARSTQEGAPA